MRTLLIGDIHGHLRALQAALQAAEISPDDTLVFLGDYVNGGDESASVIELLIDLQRRGNTVCLRGNHDDMFEASLESQRAMEAFVSIGGGSTIRSYPGGAPDGVPPAHKRFLADLRLAWHDDHLICVHGRIGPLASPANPDRNEALWGRVDDAQPHESGRTVVCGHSRQRSGEPLDLGHTICIDTGIKEGGWLTILEAGSWRYIQADAEGRVRRAELHRV